MAVERRHVLFVVNKYDKRIGITPGAWAKTQGRSAR
jgi:hypothetical protein